MSQTPGSRQDYLLATIDEATCLAARHTLRGRRKLATALRAAAQKANQELGQLLRGAA